MSDPTRPSKAIKLNDVIYYSKPKPNPEYSWDRENHWDILARVVKELCPEPAAQQKLLDDIDAEVATIEFGYPKSIREDVTFVPEGFTTIEREVKEYTAKARINLKREARATEAPAPAPIMPVGTGKTGKKVGQPGYSENYCNCHECMKVRAGRLPQKWGSIRLDNG